jgi:membrane protein DedA with SNARE-associated domain
VNWDVAAFGAFWTAALGGMAQPWVIGLVLALTTLLLEDVAIAAGVAVATQGALSWEWAFVTVAGGIALGDLALYGLGKASQRVGWLRRKYIEGREASAGQVLRRELAGAVLLARVVPGLRLVTYTACGFLRVPFGPFSAWVVLAVALWTAGLFWFSSALGAVIAERWNVPVALAVALPVVALALLVPLVRWWRKPRTSSSTLA